MSLVADLPNKITDKQFLCGILIGIYILIAPLINKHAYEPATPLPSPSAKSVSAVETQVLEDEDGAAVFCSLTDVVCDGEIPVAVNPQRGKVLLDSPRPRLAEMDTLREVCKSKGFGETCTKILYSMAKKESRFVNNIRGDYRKGVATAYGYFQIRRFDDKLRPMHKVDISCTDDLKCSAEWTLKRMMRFGFSENSYWLAVERHNGAGEKAQKYATEVISYALAMK